MAIGARARGMAVVAVTSVAQSMARHAGPPERARGCSTTPTSSSTCARRPVTRWSALDGLDTPIGPGSTVANAAIVNEIKVQTAAILLERARCRR